MTKRIIEKSDALRLKAFGENYETVMERASAENWPPAKIMEHFFDLELERRRELRVEKCYKESKLTEKPTIDQFDFGHHASRKKQRNRILDLLTLSFVEENTDVILIGNPVETPT